MDFLFFKKISSLLNHFFKKRHSKRVVAFVVDDNGKVYKVGPYSTKYRVLYAVERLIGELVAEGRLDKDRERYYREGIKL